jgi:hypothetical protein
MTARLSILYEQIEGAGVFLGRKLTSYRGAPAIDLCDIPEANFLPVYRAAALAGAGSKNADYLTANPLENFKTCPPENVFILAFDAGGRRFLINREGFSYARYIARLIG